MENENDLTLRPTVDASEIRERAARIDRTFRELAIYEVAPVNDQVAAMLAAKVKAVRAAYPELDEVEAYAVAGRLLKQLISCYMSGLNLLLP